MAMMASLIASAKAFAPSYIPAMSIVWKSIKVSLTAPVVFLPTQPDAGTTSIRTGFSLQRIVPNYVVLPFLNMLEYFINPYATGKSSDLIGKGKSALA